MLAQILAILSGVWIVGASIYASCVTNMMLLGHNTITLKANAIFSNNLNVSAAFDNLTQPLLDTYIEAAGKSLKGFKNLFIWAGACAGASLICWLVGSMRPSSSTRHIDGEVKSI